MEVDSIQQCPDTTKTLQCIEETRKLLETVKNDLCEKRVIMREQRSLLARQHLAMKSYLDTQIVMLAWHIQRLAKFQGDVEVVMAGMEDEDAADGATNNVGESPKSRITRRESEPAGGKRRRLRRSREFLSLRRSRRKRNEEGAEAEAAASEAERAKKIVRNMDPAAIAADMSKIRRRCKHILDVSDRYCVLFQEELELKAKASGTTSALERRARSTGSVDMVGRAGSSSCGEEDAGSELDSEGESSGRTSRQFSHSPQHHHSYHQGELVVPPNQIMQNVVKAMFNSLGSHLSVLAKTYSRSSSM